jgi:hypothetical protein
MERLGFHAWLVCVADFDGSTQAIGERQASNANAEMLLYFGCGSRLQIFIEIV